MINVKSPSIQIAMAVLGGALAGFAYGLVENRSSKNK